MSRPVEGSRLIKNSAFTLLNTLFGFATTWVISVWVARQLGPSNYGIFNLVLWLTGTFSWAVGMGLIHAVTKFIAEFKGKSELPTLRPIVIFVLKIEIVFSVVVTVILVFFTTQISSYFFTPNQSFFFLLAFLGLVPGIITAVFSAVIEGIQKFEYFTFCSVIISPLSFGCKVAVLILGWGINGLLYVMLLFSFVNVVMYYVILKKEGVFAGERAPLHKEIRQRILGYNRSVIAILLCDKIVWDKSENFFLGKMCHSEQIGYYNLGYNLVQKLTSVLPYTFWRVLFPAMSAYFGSGDKNKMKRLFFLATRYLAFVAFPLGIAGTILSYQIIHFIYGREYLGAQHVLQILFASSILYSLSNPASAILYGFEKQSFIYKYGAVLACLNIGLDFLLIRRYGALGASICYGVTTIFGSVGGLIYTCRLMKLTYPIVSVCKIIFATIIMGIVMELIIYKNGGLPGFIAAMVLGSLVYLISSLALGTFEQEDFFVLRSLGVALPGPFKKVPEFLVNFIASFKGSLQETR